MSALTFLASEDQFQCSICLNVFSDPVTIPCGHSFCNACLSKHWDTSKRCQCPECFRGFHERPEVATNTVIEGISVQVKRRRVEAAGGADAPWRVKCDVCSGLKFEAQKSCLVCLTSYCEAHLEPHCRVPSLMRHKLIDPVFNLEDRVCEKHEKILEHFCRDDQVCICLLCCQTEHKDHKTVPVEEEAPIQRESVGSKMAKNELMIENRAEKIKELTDSSQVTSEKANKEIEDSEKLFDAMISRVQMTKAKVKTDIEQKLRKSHKDREAVIEELQEEIIRLQKYDSELEELSQCDDHLHLLQTIQAQRSLADTRDWSAVRIYSDVCMQVARTAMSDLVCMFQTELKTLTSTELTRMKQNKESVTFDSATAGSGLMVYECGKRLKYKSEDVCSSDDSDRFSRPMIFGTKGFTSGRHYWEVRVGLRNDWDVGVAMETVSKKESIFLQGGVGFYAIGKRGFDYRVDRRPFTTLNLCPRPRNVGVYVDYAEGRVSFYDVDQKLHIHSFTGESFTEKLFPYFYLYSKAKKSEPLVINSMEHLSILIHPSTQ